MTAIEDLVRQRLHEEASKAGDGSHLVTLSLASYPVPVPRKGWLIGSALVGTVVAATVVGAAWLDNQDAPSPTAVSATPATSASPQTSASTSTTTPKPTVYSDKELLEAGDKVFFAGREGKVPPPARWAGFDDGTGLYVFVPADVLDENGREELEVEYSAVAGMPVKVRVGEFGSPAGP